MTKKISTSTPQTNKKQKARHLWTLENCLYLTDPFRDLPKTPTESALNISSLPQQSRSGAQIKQAAHFFSAFSMAQILLEANGLFQRPSENLREQDLPRAEDRTGALFLFFRVRKGLLLIQKVFRLLLQGCLFEINVSAMHRAVWTRRSKKVGVIDFVQWLPLVRKAIPTGFQWTTKRKVDSLFVVENS